KFQGGPQLDLQAQRITRCKQFESFERACPLRTACSRYWGCLEHEWTCRPARLAPDHGVLAGRAQNFRAQIPSLLYPLKPEAGVNRSTAQHRSTLWYVLARPAARIVAPCDNYSRAIRRRKRHSGHRGVVKLHASVYRRPQRQSYLPAAEPPTGACASRLR